MTLPAVLRRPPVLVHAAVVTGLVLLFAALGLASDPDDGANIGAGLVLLPLLGLGLPWSLPWIVDPYRFDRLPDLLWYALCLGPAVLNVVLHAVLVTTARARRRRARAAVGG